jgi:FAD/FMN-containing dehydrogenase
VTRGWLGWVAIALAGCGAQAPAPRGKVARAAHCRCAPGQKCWPSKKAWERLGSELDGKLVRPQAVKPGDDPFVLQEQSGATQSSGWLGAWKSAPSEYAIAAASTEDVRDGVRFAKKHDLRAVIKGTGHDYLGRSSSPGSLLIWTHAMRTVTVHDSFAPASCSDAVPAVSIGAGARWGEVYDEVSVKHHRYVQGGGCTSVGAAGGFLQGGGFGSFSKQYGTAAAGMLEAEVVTADGDVVVANHCQNADLFWALRGGGGGTFGVVTRVTLMTHPLPRSMGGVFGTITAKNDEAYRALVARFVQLYRERLNNEHWGEQLSLRGDNTLRLSLLFSNLTREKAIEAWVSFQKWIDTRSSDYTMKAEFVVIPPDKLWDAAYLEKNVPGAIARSSAGERLFFWANNKEELNAYWYAYGSRWLPIDRFGPDLARTLFEASRQWTVTLHFNKGQAGTTPRALARGKETATNPAVFDAAALVIVAAHRETDRDKPEEEKARVDAAMKIIRDGTPGAGAYVNEADYFEPNWQETFWGTNYQKLLALKRKYDPDGLFYCHHCVGSEEWSDDGMCRK